MIKEQRYGRNGRKIWSVRSLAINRKKREDKVLKTAKISRVSLLLSLYPLLLSIILFSIFLENTKKHDICDLSQVNVRTKFSFHCVRTLDLLLVPVSRFVPFLTSLAASQAFAQSGARV